MCVLYKYTHAAYLENICMYFHAYIYIHIIYIIYKLFNIQT